MMNFKFTSHGLIHTESRNLQRDKFLSNNGRRDEMKWFTLVNEILEIEALLERRNISD